MSGWVETVGILCTAFMLKAVIFRYGLDGIWPINENIAANGSMLVDGNLVFGWKHWGNSWGKIPWQFPAAGRLENSQKNTNESMYIFLLKILVSMVGLGVSIEDVFPHEKTFMFLFCLDFDRLQQNSLTKGLVKGVLQTASWWFEAWEYEASIDLTASVPWLLYLDTLAEW